MTKPPKPRRLITSISFLSEEEVIEFRRLGATKWVRKLLLESIKNKKGNTCAVTSPTSS